MADDKRLSVTLINPSTGRPVVIPLKRFTAANLEGFADVEEAEQEKFARTVEEASAHDGKSIDADARFALRREYRRKGVRLRLTRTWALLQSAIDADSIKADDIREGVMADPEVDDRWLAAADFTEVEAAVRSFRGLLGLEAAGTG